jgi:hypothetical protein
MGSCGTACHHAAIIHSKCTASMSLRSTPRILQLQLPPTWRTHMASTHGPWLQHSPLTLLHPYPQVFWLSLHKSHSTAAATAGGASWQLSLHPVCSAARSPYWVMAASAALLPAPQQQQPAPAAAGSPHTATRSTTTTSNQACVMLALGLANNTVELWAVAAPPPPAAAPSTTSQTSSSCNGLGSSGGGAQPVLLGCYSCSMRAVLYSMALRYELQGSTTHVWVASGEGLRGAGGCTHRPEAALLRHTAGRRCCAGMLAARVWHLLGPTAADWQSPDAKQPLCATQNVQSPQPAMQAYMRPAPSKAELCSN